MKVLSIILLVLFLASVCFAEWADIPLRDIVKKSDLIVVGTLDEVKEHTKNGIAVKGLSLFTKCYAV